MAQENRTPLLDDKHNLRQRSHHFKGKNSEPRRYDDDWDPSLPYGGKVFLARRKKPDPWWFLVLETIDKDGKAINSLEEALVLAVCFAFALLYFAYFYHDHMHYHVARGYAHLGFSEAQHVVGQRLLHGKGVEQDQHRAMEWFKKAADQGHPHAAYNVAVGHLKGLRTDLLKDGETHSLINHAASNGVAEARQVLQEVCAKGKCT